HRGVADDAERVRARGQRDHPEPVAGAAHVVGRAPAVRWRAAGAPGLVVGPVVGVEDAVDPPPGGIGIVAVGLGQAQLALEQAGAAARVDNPARGQAAFAAVARPGDAMVLVALAEFDPAHHHAVAEPDAHRPRAFAEHVLEAAAIDLPGRRRQQLADADLGAAV